tara:strand:- start:1003 stop:2340 length:1338 start_codon:yes stop_codon:yes gene_type:complete
MNLQRRLRSKLLNIIFSAPAVRARQYYYDWRRRLSGKGHVVSVFLQLDDPYSYILSHYLPALSEQFDIELRVYLSRAQGDDYQPAPDMLVEYAIKDCARLAQELGIAFLDKGGLPPTEHRAGMSDALAANVSGATFQADFYHALAVYWRGDSAMAAELSHSAPVRGAAVDVVNASQELQQKLGHFNSATLHYSGDWYWGIDRLHYLVDRLNSVGAAREDTADPRLISISQAMQVSLPIRPPAAAKELPAIEFFHSFRSPYSYLALARTLQIADAFGIDVQLRPVMPMVMRGMQVPRSKLMYIARDSYREAQRRGVNFGKIADPVGRGAERCQAVFQYADAERRGRDFLLHAGRAIWAEAIDVATDAGMRKVTGRCGLFWPEVKQAMQNDGWRTIVEANRDSMMASGSWGVPTIRMGDFVAWGQDRDWMLVRHIEELCDSGDGILV